MIGIIDYGASLSPRNSWTFSTPVLPCPILPRWEGGESGAAQFAAPPARGGTRTDTSSSPSWVNGWWAGQRPIWLAGGVFSESSCFGPPR